MPLFARRVARRSTGSAEAVSDTALGTADWRVGVDDRAGPLPGRPSRLRAAMPLCVLLAGGGALYANPWIVNRSLDWLWQQADALRGPLPAPLAKVDARVPSGEADPSSPLASSMMGPSTGGPSTVVGRAAAPTEPSPESAPAARAALAPAGSSSSAVPPSNAPEAPAGASSGPGAPYAPPRPPAAEAFQMRAEAVGLHPDMSKAVLARLSQGDLQNARIAIEKALGEAGEDVIVVWPRQRKVGEAQFQVHFVPGTDAECRRYVVAVAKDGWQTTGLPMERCADLSASRKFAPK